MSSLQENKMLMALSWHYVYAEMEDYIFGRMGDAFAHIEDANMVDEGAPTTMPQIEHHLFKPLILARQYKRHSSYGRAKLNFVAKRSIKLLGQWTEAQPENFKSRYLLAKAEWAGLTDAETAYGLFSEAVSDAHRNGNFMLEALAQERWARLLIDQGKSEQAKDHLVSSHAAWNDWGAHRKAEQLASEFPELFERTSSESKETSEQQTFSNLIDLEAVLRATQAISGEIVLDNLLKKLLKILVENLGAQRGFLILNRDESLRIEAEISDSVTEAVTLSSEDVSGSEKLSTSIINLAFRTGNKILIDDAQTDPRYGGDEYVRKNQVHSVLCVPVSYQGNVVAIAYFENNLVANVFTENRVAMATMLASQAAISIQNAMLYDNMEMLVKERTAELEREMRKSDDLLLNILPSETAKELKATGTSKARSYDNVSVLFTDFVNFTQMSERMSPEELINELHECFKAFDEITVKYSIEKIKTVGDAYIAVSGLPQTNPNHGADILKAAIEIRDFMAARKLNRPDKTYEIRIGVHSGSVISGIVGVRKFAFDIWGDAVNTAARMEQNSEPGKINVSKSTYELVKDQFEFIHRGKIKAKGKGEIDMYFVA